MFDQRDTTADLMSDCPYSRSRCLNCRSHHWNRRRPIRRWSRCLSPGPSYSLRHSCRSCFPSSGDCRRTRRCRRQAGGSSAWCRPRCSRAAPARRRMFRAGRCRTCCGNDARWTGRGGGGGRAECIPAQRRNIPRRPCGRRGIGTPHGDSRRPPVHFGPSSHRAAPPTASRCPRRRRPPLPRVRHLPAWRRYCRQCRQEQRAAADTQPPPEQKEDRGLCSPREA